MNLLRKIPANVYIAAVIAILVVISGIGIARSIGDDIATQEMQAHANAVAANVEADKPLPPKVVFTAADYPCSVVLDKIYAQNVSLDPNESVIPNHVYCSRMKLETIALSGLNAKVNHLAVAYCEVGNDASKRLSLNNIYGSLYGTITAKYEAYAGYTLIDWHQNADNTARVYFNVNWGVPTLLPIAQKYCPSSK